MTRQISETFFFRGEVFQSGNYPLECLIDVQSRRAGLRGGNTACRRGYVGHWRIEDQRLVLDDIRQAGDLGHDASILKVLFPSSGCEGVTATWFTGRLALRESGSWSGPKTWEDADVKFILLIEAGIVVEVIDAEGEAPVEDHGLLLDVEPILKLLRNDSN